VGLILLLVAACYGARQRRWEGLVPYHRDWMDSFLFHVSLDEILP